MDVFVLVTEYKLSGLVGTDWCVRRIDELA